MTVGTVTQIVLVLFISIAGTIVLTRVCEAVNRILTFVTSVSCVAKAKWFCTKRRIIRTLSSVIDHAITITRVDYGFTIPPCITVGTFTSIVKVLIITVAGTIVLTRVS